MFQPFNFQKPSTPCGTVFIQFILPIKWWSYLEIFWAKLNYLFIGWSSLYSTLNCWTCEKGGNISPPWQKGELHNVKFGLRCLSISDQFKHTEIEKSTNLQDMRFEFWFFSFGQSCFYTPRVELLLGHSVESKDEPRWAQSEFRTFKLRGIV